jgi:hypothetical protein
LLPIAIQRFDDELRVIDCRDEQENLSEVGQEEAETQKHNAGGEQSFIPATMYKVLFLNLLFQM